MSDEKQSNVAFRRTQLGLMKIIDLKNMYQLEEDKAGNMQCVIYYVITFCYTTSQEISCQYDAHCIKSIVCLYHYIALQNTEVSLLPVPDLYGFIFS